MRKEVKGFGMPWEDVSGQLSHDADGNMVGATPPDMAAQMRQTYVNAKKILAEFGATLDDVVEEVLYVTDMDQAFAAAGPVRKEAYGSARPAVASTILVTSRLALAAQLVEIKFVAKTRP